MDEVLQSQDCDAGPSGVIDSQPAKRKRTEEASPSARNSACAETNEPSTVDQHSDVLEQMESVELPAEVLVQSASEGNYSKECSSCNAINNEGSSKRGSKKTERYV